MDLEFNHQEDFVVDESFVNYCLGSNNKEVLFWKNWLQEHPEKKEITDQARTLVFMISIRIAPENMEQQWQVMIAKINDSL